MNQKEYLDRIANLTSKINSLPKGYISKKVISDKVYFYHQWSENGTKQSRYLHDGEIKILAEQIDKRKELQNELKDIKSKMAGINTKEDSSILQCTLMHKQIPVVVLEINQDHGFIQKIGQLYSIEHLPVGVALKNNGVNKQALNNWWTERSIPASRTGIHEALETLKITNTKILLTRCYGLSLSDQYWICPKGSNFSWGKINFFTNEFSDDIGDVLFGSDKKQNPLNFSSPDNTSDGNLKKRWKIINNKRCLIKGGSNPYRQQPLNEVIATEIMSRLKINCVSYSVTWNNGAPYSICENFVNEKTELVPAWCINQVLKRQNNSTLYEHFVNCAEKLGIPHVVEFLDRMIVLDYIIANEDRHMNNFGALRNAESLEWIGMAPIYDSGSSLGYDKNSALMNKKNEIICKPFKNTHDEQLELVTSFDWIDFDALSDIGTVITNILSDSNARAYLDITRIQTIAYLTELRVTKLKALAKQAAVKSYKTRKAK